MTLRSTARSLSSGMFYFLSVLSFLYLVHVALAPRSVSETSAAADEVPVRVTRGPVSQSDRQYQEFLEYAKSLPPESSFVAVLLQNANNAISVNAEIPVWGVFLAILTGVAAFVALREQMKSHIKSDDSSFLEVKSSLKDLKRDMRSLRGLPHEAEDD